MQRWVSLKGLAKCIRSVFGHPLCLHSLCLLSFYFISSLDWLHLVSSHLQCIFPLFLCGSHLPWQLNSCLRLTHRNIHSCGGYSCQRQSIYNGALLFTLSRALSSFPTMLVCTVIGLIVIGAFHFLHLSVVGSTIIVSLICILYYRIMYWLRG